MQEPSIYESIFRRRSVRRFDMSGRDTHIADMIRRLADGLEPLDPSIRTAFPLLLPEQIRGGLFGVRAPYYIAAYSTPDEGDLLNIGYMLQQLDLKLSALGVGYCWLGTAKPGKMLPPEDGLEFVIAMAAGAAAEALHREQLSEFKRRPLNELTDLREKDHDAELLAILEAARLAPSATNSQPWFFTGSPAAIRVLRKSLNPLMAIAYDRMNRIDIGIALCHLRIAAEHFGREVSFEREAGSVPAAEGYDYCMTIRMK